MTGDEGATVAEERQDRDEHPDSFDPGLETGYLRRGPRERELPLDAGAAPFDPGPGIGYDSKRAKREAKKREKDARERPEPEAAAGPALAEPELDEVDLGEADLEEGGLDDVEALERDRAERARLGRERHERELAEREARLQREREELELQAKLEEEERERELEERRQREELEGEERRREELERRALIEEQRDHDALDERERRRRERDEKREQWAREREALEGERRQQEERERERLAAKKRRRAKRQVALARARSPRSTRPAPRRTKSEARPAPKLRRPPRRGQLAAPTAKVGLALASVIGAATLLGAAIGLPVPVITSDDDFAASLAGAGVLNDSGTPTGLTKGPYFPVVLDGPADFGESAAKFHADRGGRKHEGQDIFAKPGTPLVAVRDGIVIDGGGGRSFYSYGGGNTVVIYSPLDQRSYVYLHMLKPSPVRAGETVHAGQVVGQMGCTGSCDGTHLHFEVRNGQVAYGVDTKPVDPLPLLQQWPQVSTDSPD